MLSDTLPDTDMTLSDALAERGITHQPGDHGRRKLYGPDGAYLGMFSCFEAWDLTKFAEDLTPEGIQLVIPGAERVQPPSVKQGELF